MNHSRTLVRSLRSERGLTLVEIIVVLVILSILIAFLTTGLFNRAGSAKATINKLRMNEVKSAINQYQLMYNSLPPDLNALVTCNDQTGPACMQLATEETIKDAYGNRFMFLAQGGGRQFQLKSLGADGRDGGTGEDADVVLAGP